MSKSSLVLCFVLVALSHAKEIVSLSKSGQCASLPPEVQDTCLTAIQTNGSFDFIVPEANSTKANDMNRRQAATATQTRPNQVAEQSPKLAANSADRQTLALEAMAISTAKTAEASRISAKSLAIMAGIQVAGVVLAVVAVLVFAIR